jgi:hypothetical protein
MVVDQLAELNGIRVGLIRANGAVIGQCQKR